MKLASSNSTVDKRSDLLKSLVDFSKGHRAARWAGTFANFLETIFPADAREIARPSHQYIWDMMRAKGFDEGGFAHTGRAGNADTHAAAGVRQKGCKQRLRLRTIGTAGGLDERDRTCQRPPVAAQNGFGKCGQHRHD